MAAEARPNLKERALILGVNGQDGSYLAESLLRRGWDVHGLARQPRARAELPAEVTYLQHDLRDVDGYAAHLERLKPDAVFHVAAVHGPAGFAYESSWKDAHLVNTLCAHATLDYARAQHTALRYFYFSSSKVFGDLQGRTINEASPRSSSCIYTATKNCATDLVRHYRERFGVRGATLWFFHHESPRRSAAYFVPTVLAHLRGALADRSYRARVKTLGFWSDWGDAAEYMELLAEVTSRGPGRDLVFATGQTLWARDFVRELFARRGLDFAAHIEEEAIGEATPDNRWQVNIEALRRICGRGPSVTLADVSERMLSAGAQASSPEASL